MSSPFEASSLFAVSPSKTVLSPLADLKHVELQPERRPRTVTVAAQLQRVSCVEFTRGAVQADKARDQTYIATIHCDDSKCLAPSSLQVSAKSSPSSPLGSVQVVVTAAQCCSLRNSIHACVQNDHRRPCCSSCEQLGRFMKFDGGRAMAFAQMAFDSKGDASQLLTDFVDYLMGMCRSLQVNGVQASCKGQRRIPQLLHAFLFNSTGQLREALSS